jgi:hypothetical protein
MPAALLWEWIAWRFFPPLVTPVCNLTATSLRLHACLTFRVQMRSRHQRTILPPELLLVTLYTGGTRYV